MSSTSAAFHAADQGFLVPRCTAPEFVSTMLDICRRNNVGLIVPTIDTELPIYAATVDEFAAAGVTILISDPQVIEIASDKRRTHEWLVETGLPTVRQAEVADVLANPGDWAFPLLVKPVGGSSSIGVATVATREELSFATRDGDYIVQTLAQGTEYTIDALIDRSGHCVCAVPRKRLEVRAGEVSKAVTFRSAELIALAKRVFESLPGAFGVQNVQVFLNDDGDMRIIEINPRFGGGYPLSWQAGAHYPRWLIEEQRNLPSTVTEDWQDGLTMLRYDDAVFVAPSTPSSPRREDR